jgi:hypothetical protein
MVWTLKLNAGVDILVFFSLVTVLATFQKFWQFFPPIFWSPWLQPQGKMLGDWTLISAECLACLKGGRVYKLPIAISLSVFILKVLCLLKRCFCRSFNIFGFLM